MNSGQKQLYGTQFNTVDGINELQPVEDEENLNKRRLEIGLEPVEEYVRDFKQRHDLPNK